MNELLGTGFVNPDVVATHFHLRDGDRVADFGAGTGYFLRALSKGAGLNGRVYACEIQKKLVEKIASEAKNARLSNVEVIWSDLEAPGGTKLRDGILDGGLLANTLFQLENKVSAFIEMARVIRTGGKLFIIDWTESFGGLGPLPGHVVPEYEATRLAEANGFRFERTFPSGEHHYGIALRRV